MSPIGPGLTREMTWYYMCLEARTFLEGAPHPTVDALSVKLHQGRDPCGLTQSTGISTDSTDGP